MFYCSRPPTLPCSSLGHLRATGVYHDPASVSYSPEPQPQSSITFVPAAGSKIPLDIKKGSLRVFDYLNSRSRVPSLNGGHPADDSEDDFSDSVDTIVRRELHTRDVHNVRHFNAEGHHFGGYHPGKNKRQKSSIRYELGEMLQNPFNAAEIFGMPMVPLYRASILLNDGITSK